MGAIPFHTAPRGAAYVQFIDHLIEKTGRFLLVDRQYDEQDTPQRVARVLQRLNPYLIERCTMENMMLRSGAFYTEGIYYIYECTPDSGQILKEEATGFLDWLYPSLPDDLCFLREDGSDYLFTVAHEDICGMHITDEEARELMDRIPGLFFVLEKHRELNSLLDDAIRHQTDVLHITSHHLTEIPERIRELKHLKRLEIFEQDVYTLPPALFELTTLEELTIITSDLESLPPDIGKLKQLRHLTIYCGSSYDVAPGWKPKPKRELGLNAIPAEIGELTELVSLNIGYSGIRELPLELEKLKKLRYLNVTNGLIEGTPRVLSRMTWLENVDLASTPMGIGREEILAEDELL